MAVAVCCLLAIFITLAKFDHQEQPEWPYARTLNLSTLVALLATTLSSMLENVLNAGKFILTRLALRTKYSFINGVSQASVN